MSRSELIFKKVEHQLSAHWLFGPSNSDECEFHGRPDTLRFYIRFRDTRMNGMVSSESLVLVYCTGIIPLSTEHHVRSNNLRACVRHACVRLPARERPSTNHVMSCLRKTSRG